MDLMAQLNAITDLDWFEIQGYEAKELRDFILEKDAEIERLREALRTLSEFDANPSGSGAAYGQCGEMVRFARSALQRKDSE